MPAPSRASRLHPSRRAALLLAAAGLVHAVAGTGTVHAQTKRGTEKSPGRAGTPPQVILGRGEKGLPPAVADMRAAILAAVERADMAELRVAMDLNELRPEVGAPAGSDPIDHLRSLTPDGSGKDILVMLGRLLDGGWAAIPGGRDIENNRLYVWPHFAETPIAALDSQGKAELEALVGAEEARIIADSGRYRGWRLSIGADGVWHMLTVVGR